MAKAKARKTASEYLKEPYTRLLTPNGAGGFTAEMLEFPGCISDGDTAEEAMNNLEEAASGWIEGMLLHKGEIPEPMDNDGYSGKFALRMPRSLHRAAARLAERDKTSLNTFFIAAISAAVRVEEFTDRAIDRLTESQMERALNVEVRLDQRVSVTQNFLDLPKQQIYMPPKTDQPIGSQKKSSLEVRPNA